MVIIGGGILGWVLAHLLSKCRGLKDALIISSERLHTSSLQNQAWLHTGLIYDLDSPEGREDAELCIQHGRKLLDLRNISVTDRFGIMALANEEEALKKATFLGRWGFPQYGGILSQEEVERLLGKDFSRSSQFTRDTCFIKTPDQPFDEGGFLRFFQVSLQNAPFSFQQIQGIAAIKRSLVARNGYSVSVNGEEIDPGKLFVIAGVNTQRILLPLGIAERINLTARRCILMQAPMMTDLSADLYMDTLSRLNVNTVTNWIGQKRCLFGDILNSPVEDLTRELVGRAVTEEDKWKLLDNLCKPEHYPQLKERLLPFMADDRNFSVCYKTESEGHKAWIFEASNYDQNLQNLYIAGSGKATMAYYAAQELLSRAKINVEPTPIPALIKVHISGMKTWYE